MEEERNSNSDKPKKKHFLKLHERIHIKYIALQKRLQKSRSVDTLSTLSDGSEYKQPIFCSSLDLRDETTNVINNKPNTHSIIVDGVEKYATVQDIQSSEANVYEPEIFTADQCSHNGDDEEENIFLGENFRTSYESINLNDIVKEHEEQYKSQTPSPRIFIRDKISQMSAIAEKRREEKQRNKERKKEQREKVEKFILSNTTKQDISKKKTKIATVTIALIDATFSENDTIQEEKLRACYCRLRLGTEKKKSKIVKGNTAEVSWQEIFNFSLFDDNMLEITLWDKDTLAGRCIIDLSELDKEKTHKMRLSLDDGLPNTQLFILLTISGVSVIDFYDYTETQKKIVAGECKLASYHISEDSTEVGSLSIVVYGAKGLSASDCYCILELGNERLQTYTDSKTNDPNWMKMFSFVVTDVTSILEVTVHDEKKSEDVGKVSIPLLRIESGKKKWYALKDSNQRERAKGNNPRILLELQLTWNLIKASFRVINTKEPKYVKTRPKFDRHLFAKDWSRAKAVLTWVYDAFKVIKTCFEWESRKWNVIALTTWLLFCWFFKIWMVPLLLMVPFVWYRPPALFLINWKRYLKKETALDVVDEKEEKTSLRQRIQDLQELVQSVQIAVGEFASLGESIKNLFNFTTPFLSCLAIFFTVVIALIMYLIPVKYIFMTWGIHKFTRKILRPNRVPNNEILDLLSRVPDDEILLNCEELPLQELPEDEI